MLTEKTPKDPTQNGWNFYRNNIFGQNPKMRAFTSQTIYFGYFFQNSLRYFKIGHFCRSKNVHFLNLENSFGKNTSYRIGRVLNIVVIELKEIIKPQQKQDSILFLLGLRIQTNNISCHGLPDKIKCPEGGFRKSPAYCYISDIVSKAENNKVGNDGSGHRTKATYIHHPHKPRDERMEKLINIRPFRRIEQADMDEIWPDWNAEDD